MSSNSNCLDNKNSNISSLNENFSRFKEEEAMPINPEEYLISIEGSRSLMVNWLSFLCTRLNFTDQTLFRSISLFDQYISRIKIEEAVNLTQENLNLIAIGCLSLATKLEEINCNYIGFLNEKVLNSENSRKYNNKDLTEMEMKILKRLKYKTMYSTAIDFIEVYIEIFRNYIGVNNSMNNLETISEIKLLAINIMKNNINNILFLTNSSSDFAYLAFIKALNQVRMMNSFQMKQIEQIIFTFNYQCTNII